jgi:hypothetical protein
MLNHADDIWGMATSSAFGVVGVDCPVLESSDSGFNEAGLIEGISVNEDLDVQFIADSKTGIDSGWCRSPIFVKLQPTGPSHDLLTKACRRTVVSFTRYPNVHG